MKVFMGVPSEEHQRRRWRPLGIVLAVTFLFRLGSFWAIHAVDPSRMMTPDSASYEDSARALLQWGRFASPPQAPMAPSLMRTPGYPAFIAGVFGAFGPGSYRALIAAQIVAGVGTIALAWLLARWLAGSGTALLAAVLLALDPLSFLYSQLMLSETLFTLLLTAGAFFGVRLLVGQEGGGYGRGKWMGWTRSARKTSGWGASIFSNAWLMGTMLALATLVRPVLQYAIYPLLLLVLAVFGIRRRSWKAALVAVLLCVLPWVLLVGGWKVRNAVRAGITDLSTIEVYNMLWYRGAGIVAWRQGISLHEARERIERGLPDTRGWTVRQVNDLYRREALALARQDPSGVLVIFARGVVYQLGGIGGAQADEYFGLAGAGHLWWVVLAGGYLVVLYGGIILWALRVAAGERDRWPAHALLGFLVFYLVVVSAGPEAYSRFRVPLMPILALYAAMCMGERRKGLPPESIRDPAGRLAK